MILEIDLPEDQWKLIERKAIANGRTIQTEVARRLKLKVNKVNWRVPRSKGVTP